MVLRMILLREEQIELILIEKKEICKMIDLNYGENYREEILLKHEIEKKISEKYDVPEKQVLLNYGSNSNLILFFSALSLKSLNEGKRLKVLLDVPNYFFSIKQLEEWNIEPVFVKREESMEFPFDKFLKCLKKENPDVILLTTPNNPTGKPIGDEELVRIIRESSEECIVLFDRSCVNILPEISTRDLLKESRKIVVLHSLSKSHSLSDERLGYLVTNSSELAEIFYNKRDLNHNIHAVRKCLVALDDDNVLEKKKNIIKECNGLLESYCRDSEVVYYKSYSNFAILKLPSFLTSEDIESFMLENGVLIMGGHGIGLGDGYIRVHMSGAKEIKVFLENLDVLLKKK